MGVAISGMKVLDALARDNQSIEVADELDRIADEWGLRISGIHPNTRQRISKHYGFMASYEEKLKVVHFGEDKCLEALATFSQTH